MLRQRQYQRSSGSRPNRDWSGVVSTGLTAVAGGTKVLLGSFVPTAGVDETILRSVGVLFIQSDALASASEFQIGAFGMIKVTSNAFAAGAASIPGPVTDIGDDWIIYQSWVQANQLFMAIDFDSMSGVSYAFDSKAKRVVEGEGQTVALMVENAHATHSFNIGIAFRVLSQIRGTR